MRKERQIKLYTGKVEKSDEAEYLFLDLGSNESQYVIEWDDNFGQGSCDCWNRMYIDKKNKHL